MCNFGRSCLIWSAIFPLVSPRGLQWGMPRITAIRKIADRINFLMRTAVIRIFAIPIFSSLKGCTRSQWVVILIGNLKNVLLFHDDAHHHFLRYTLGVLCAHNKSGNFWVCHFLRRGRRRKLYRGRRVNIFSSEYYCIVYTVYPA